MQDRATSLYELTIFTPSYNRETNLSTLYQSLLNQSNKNFIWLIVDDGSKDHTKEVVDRFIQENQLTITYVYQKNAGKHIARNTALGLCSTEYFLGIDSDDVAYPYAVEEAYAQMDSIRTEEQVCGVVFPRKMGDSQLIVAPPEYCTYFSLYGKIKYRGETSVLYKTNVLKQYLYPIIQNENFMAESVVLQKIDMTYRYRIVNRFIIHGDYLPNGLSAKLMKHYENCPKGYLLTKRTAASCLKCFVPAAKNYGAYLAWKRKKRLADAFAGELPVKSSVKMIGSVLQWYYFMKLFL